MARTGIFRHSVIATGADSGDQVSVNAWNADLNKAGMLGFEAETIASAASVTPSNTTIILSGSTNVSTLAITNTADKDLLYIFTSGTVNLVNTATPTTAGDIKLLGDANKALSATVPTILMRVGNFWYEYGGGSTSNIVNSQISASAAIDASKIADGSVSNAEYQYIGTLTSNAQTQLDGKVTSGGALGTPSSGTLTSCSGLPQSGVTNLTTDLAAKAPLASPSFTTDISLTAQAPLKLKDLDSSNFVAFRAPATISSDITWTLPATDGTSGQVISTNGAGTLSWASAGGGASAELNPKLQSSAYSPTYTAPAIEGTDPVSIWIATIDANNQGVYAKIKKNGSYVTVQIA